MAWQPEPGCTLLVPSGPGKHLHVVVLGPVALRGYGSNPQLALVSVTTRREGLRFDSTCEVAAGEHPFVHHPSYIAYRHLHIADEPHARRMVATATWAPNDPCSPKLLARIRAGVCSSPFTSNELRSIFGCH